MNKIYNKKINLFILIFAFLFLPYISNASSIYLETERTNFFTGDTILVDVKIDSGDKEINTVEGTINLDYLPEIAEIKDIILAGSSFSLWPNKPSLLENQTKINFTGGIPNGLKKQNASLFKIAINLKNAGQLTLTPENISVFINDGKGTTDITEIKNLSINILPQEIDSKSINDLDTLISQDTIPPLPFEIILGQHDSVFDGKKFLSFNTTDEQSGIKYYEVIEGDLEKTRSDGTYVLKNQNKKNEIRVIAYDMAGNTTESVYISKSYISSHPIISIFISVIIFLTILIIFFKGIKKTKNENIKN